MTTGQRPAVGQLLRAWRERRRVSQLDLAIGAGVSARHVSFVENGRARPSPDMVLRLAEHLDVPLRERNQLLLAAGHAPAYPVGSLDAGQLAPVRGLLRQVLAAHLPAPALVVDRGWRLVDANPAVAVIVTGADPALLAPPVNVLRLSLHPRGLAARIDNLAQWRGVLLARLAREVATTADPGLSALLAELRDYPGGEDPGPYAAGVAVPLLLRVGGAQLHLLSTVTTFGTAVDVTLAELSVEAFLPADEATAAALRALPSGPG